MKSIPALFALVAVCLASSSCTRSSTTVAAAESEPAPLASIPEQESKIIRATGIIQALEWQSIRVPQLASGGSARQTITKLIPNGTKVSKGDLLVEFDRTSLFDDERDAKARLKDLTYQLEQGKAQAKSDLTRRLANIKQAEADLQKAQLELRKGPVLSNIDKRKNEARSEDARQRVLSLKKSDELRQKSEAATVKIYQLRQERQKVTLERIQINLERLLVLAPQDGMVALENSYRNGSMGPLQEGDQVHSGLPILRIFNPQRMVVQTTVNEPDIAALSSGAKGKLFVDAYPGEMFDAKLESSSPIATPGTDSPVRTFNAIFRVVQQNSLLMPDLSAAIEIERGTK